MCKKLFCLFLTVFFFSLIMFFETGRSIDSLSSYVLYLFSKSASGVGLIGILTICILLLNRVSDSKRSFYKKTFVFLILLFICFGTKVILKEVTAKPRPFTEVTTQGPMWLEEEYSRTTNYSFPSGHTLLVMTIVVYIGSFYSKSFIVLLLLSTWGGAVAASRILLNFHDYIDIFGSFIIGLILSLIALKVLSLLDRDT